MFKLTNQTRSRILKILGMGLGLGIIHVMLDASHVLRTIDYNVNKHMFLSTLINYWVFLEYYKCVFLSLI